MDTRLLSNLPSGYDIALTLANREICDIVLMHRSVALVLLLHLVLFEPAEEPLRVV